MYPVLCPLKSIGVSIVALLALAGCSTFYLHNEEVQQLTSEANEAADRISLGAQFDAQETFLSDLENKTRKIQIKAKLVARDLTIAQLLNARESVFMEFDIRKNLFLGGGRRVAPNTHQLYLKETSRRDAAIGQINEHLSDLSAVNGSLKKGIEVCSQAFDKTAFLTENVTGDENIKIANGLIDVAINSNNDCIKIQSDITDLETRFAELVDPDTRKRLTRVKATLAVIKDTQEKVKNDLETITSHLICLKAQKSPSGEIAAVLYKMRDYLLIIGSRDVVLPDGDEDQKKDNKTKKPDLSKCPDVATAYKTLSNIGLGKKVDGKPDDKPNPAEILEARQQLFRNIDTYATYAEKILPGLKEARAEFMTIQLMAVLAALANQPSTDPTDTIDETAHSEEIATAKLWMRTLGSLMNAAAQLGRTNQPSMDALLVEIAYQQYQSALAAAQLTSLKKQQDLLNLSRLAQIQRTVYWAQAANARDSLELPATNNSCPGVDLKQATGLARVIDKCKGTKAARHAGEILLFVSQAFNRGDVQAHIVEFDLTNLSRKTAVSMDRVAFEGRVAILKPVLSKLKEYGESGIKTEEIVELLKAFGLSAIAFGVN